MRGCSSITACWQSGLGLGMFILYSMVAEFAVWMLLLPYELLLLLSGRSDGERVRQLMGWARLQVQGARPAILVHAVSVGEVAAAEPVIRELLASRPGLEVVLSTSSPAGLAAARAAAAALRASAAPVG